MTHSILAPAIPSPSRPATPPRLGPMVRANQTPILLRHSPLPCTTQSTPPACRRLPSKNQSRSRVHTHTPPLHHPPLGLLTTLLPAPLSPVHAEAEPLAADQPEPADQAHDPLDAYGTGTIDPAYSAEETASVASAYSYSAMGGGGPPDDGGRDTPTPPASYQPSTVPSTGGGGGSGGSRYPPRAGHYPATGGGGQYPSSGSQYSGGGGGGGGSRYSASESRYPGGSQYSASTTQYPPDSPPATSSRPAPGFDESAGESGRWCFLGGDGGVDGSGWWWVEREAE